MTSKTLRYFFDQPLSNGWQGKQEGKTKIQKIEYLENENRF